MIGKVKLLFFNKEGNKQLAEEEYTVENAYFSAKESRIFGNFEFKYTSVSRNDSDDFFTMYLFYEEI